jgi:ssDNA-binding Zn-finger/Zn-ribbon topoisomerase 1
MQYINGGTYMNYSFFNKIFAGTLAALLLSFSIGCSSNTSDHHGAAGPAGSHPLKESEYVGSERCKDCHWREHDSWKHTLHSKFMQSAGEFTMLGDFERNNKLTVEVITGSPEFAGKELDTTMFKKDGKYYVNTIGPDWEFHDYEISHVIGINRRQNYLTIFPNGAIHVLPVEWDVRKTAWINNYGFGKSYPGDGNYWSDDSRIWQYKCGGCHTTGMKINYDRASHSFNTKFANLGIGCESCHGPGNNHITAARFQYEKEKDTIINPSKLPWRLRAAVCGQCHNWGASTAKISPYREGFPERYAFPYGFKVGKPLYLYYVKDPVDDKRHHQQYNEWNASAHAEAGIMCTTCHGVHQEGMHKNPHKAQTKFIADSLCTNCHKTIKQKAAHRIHTFGSCIACHMPRTKEDEHSHTFEFISPEESLRAGGVDKQPNSCSGCHHHKDSSLEGLIEFLDSVKKMDMPIPFSVHGRD